jgi:hypothetical protein
MEREKSVATSVSGADRQNLCPADIAEILNLGQGYTAGIYK